MSTKNDIFYFLDQIDTEQSFSDCSVLESVLDVYDKASYILESAEADELDTSSFAIFQEADDETVIDGKIYYKDKGFRRVDENGVLESKLIALLKAIPRLIEMLINALKSKLNKTSTSSSNSGSGEEEKELSTANMPKINMESQTIPDPEKQLPPKRRKTANEIWEYIYTHHVRIGKKYRYNDTEFVLSKDTYLAKLIQLKKRYVSSVNRIWKKLEEMISTSGLKHVNPLKRVFNPKFAKGCKKKNLMKINMETGEINTIADLDGFKKFISSMKNTFSDLQVFVNHLDSTKDKISAIASWKLFDDSHETIQNTIIFADPKASYKITDCWSKIYSIIQDMRIVITQLNKNNSKIKKTIDDITKSRAAVVISTPLGNKVKTDMAIRKLNLYEDFITAFQYYTPRICDILMMTKEHIKLVSNMYNFMANAFNKEEDLINAVIKSKSDENDSETTSSETLETISD